MTDAELKELARRYVRDEQRAQSSIALSKAEVEMRDRVCKREKLKPGELFRYLLYKADAADSA